ncbi:hypothetical protein [Glutamicibacter soli]|uniref:hypothetical protein n=1 Tax=Glutamicibacter soli TaxID=453836 RepID=UPI001FD1A018|nr:hypothetical protein [Glutamicibacter soli]
MSKELLKPMVAVSRRHSSVKANPVAKSTLPEFSRIHRSIRRCGFEKINYASEVREKCRMRVTSDLREIARIILF